MEQISGQFSLNTRERWKGIKLGLYGAIAGYAANLIAAPGFDIVHAFQDWHMILNGALSVGGLYLLTTFTAKPPKE